MNANRQWQPMEPGVRPEPRFLRIYHLAGRGRRPQVPVVKGWLSKGALRHFTERGERWVAVSAERVPPETGPVVAIRLLGLPEARPDGVKIRTDCTIQGSVLRRMELPDRLRIDLAPDELGALVGEVVLDAIEPEATE